MISEQLKDMLSTLSKDGEDVEKSVEKYIIEILDLGKDTSLVGNERQICRNFVHLMGQIINDFRCIESNIKKFDTEKKAIANVKTNNAEYRKRKLEYFIKLNEQARNEIVSFMNEGISNYLLETSYDTLNREASEDNLGKMFRNRRYLFAQAPEYYDVDYEYTVVIKVSHLPGIELIEGPSTEKRFLELFRRDPEKYYAEIRGIIKEKNILESIKNGVEQDYYLHKRREVFEDLLRLYEQKHFQSFVMLGLLQLEGLFFDICSLRYGEKENAGTLVEKAEKAFSGGNEISFMRYYPYFAFDVPVKRNEIAHTGIINSEDIERMADELVLDLNSIMRMAKLESDGKFRIFSMINDALWKDTSKSDNLNRTLAFELFANRHIAPDSFWKVLKNPKAYGDEIEFYRLEDLPEGYVDLPTIVNSVSSMIYQTGFWEELEKMMVEIRTPGQRGDFDEFVDKMAKDYIGVLEDGAKNKCIEIMQLNKKTL